MDGATPTTNSALYTGALVLTSNAWVQATAMQSANVSAVSSANFVIVTIDPRITGIGLSGTTLSISPTIGLPNAIYVLLSTTNVTLPLIQWTPVLTNRFDSAGNLNLSTNIINPSDGQTFYILQVAVIVAALSSPPDCPSSF